MNDTLHLFLCYNNPHSFTIFQETKIVSHYYRAMESFSWWNILLSDVMSDILVHIDLFIFHFRAEKPGIFLYTI